MHVTWLKDFLALAPSCNFSRAAIERHSSQPAFSRRIRALEAWLGTELLDRSTQPARLTEAGEWFKAVAQKLLTQMERLPGEAKQVADTSAVTLRIASTHALSFTFLPQWLRGLEGRVAMGPIELMSDVLGRCEALMQQGKVQFVLAHAHPKVLGPLDGERYLSAVIGTDELVAVAQADAKGAPRYRLGGTKSAAARTPVLQYTEASGLGRIVRAVAGRKMEALGTKAGFTAHLASVLRTMALDGRGIAWVPRSLVKEDLMTHKLAEAAGEEWRVPIDIRLYRELEPCGPVAETFWMNSTVLPRAGPDQG